MCSFIVHLFFACEFKIYACNPSILTFHRNRYDELATAIGTISSTSCCPSFLHSRPPTPLIRYRRAWFISRWSMLVLIGVPSALLCPNWGFRPGQTHEGQHRFQDTAVPGVSQDTLPSPLVPLPPHTRAHTHTCHGAVLFDTPSPIPQTLPPSSEVLCKAGVLQDT